MGLVKVVMKVTSWGGLFRTPLTPVAWRLLGSEADFIPPHHKIAAVLKTEVAVVGGGSTGASILYHLAKAGTDCLLVERESQVGSGMTGRSSALIRTHYSVESVAKMALNSYQFFRDFDKNLPGRTAGYLETGLLICADSTFEKALAENVTTLRRLGAVTGVIDKDEARRIEPCLDVSGFSSLVYEPHAGYAEPSTTASSFASAARELGARFMMSTVLAGVERSNGEYTLTTDRESISAKKVVLATGPWSAPIFARLGIDLPIKPVRHPLAIYRRPTEYQGHHPIIFDFVRSGYYKPEGMYLLVVGSIELELDMSSSAADPDNYDAGIATEEVTKFTGWTVEALPVMASGGTYERGYSGVYDNTPDEQPIIDELSERGYENLFCLVGLSGHGFKLCPEYGRIMASLVTEGSFRDYDVSMFRLRRFDEGKLIRSAYNLGTIG